MNVVIKFQFVCILLGFLLNFRQPMLWNTSMVHDTVIFLEQIKLGQIKIFINMERKYFNWLLSAAAD